ARRFGRKTAAHALGTDGIRNAVRAGVDTIEHGVFLTEDIVAGMRRQGTVLCPTLATYRALAAGDGVPAYAAVKARTVVAGHRESFLMALDAGIPVIAGTDAGAPHSSRARPQIWSWSPPTRSPTLAICVRCGASSAPRS
ncbi:MAG: amidohydrolase family protein, partial [Gemmatimonas sp.]|nr:amidohydrolase family protein [Gemmatimonas sp.]